MGLRIDKGFIHQLNRIGLLVSRQIPAASRNIRFLEAVRSPSHQWRRAKSKRPDWWQSPEAMSAVRPNARTNRSRQQNHQNIFIHPLPCPGKQPRQNKNQWRSQNRSNILPRQHSEKISGSHHRPVRFSQNPASVPCPVAAAVDNACVQRTPAAGAAQRTNMPSPNLIKILAASRGMPARPGFSGPDNKDPANRQK